MVLQIYPILLLTLAIATLIGLVRTKSNRFLRLLFFVVSIGMLIGGWGLLKEKAWAAKLSNISLVAFVLLLFLPPLGRMLGVALFTQMFYEDKEEEDKKNAP